jgi:hypothetical protein
MFALNTDLPDESILSIMFLCFLIVSSSQTRRQCCDLLQAAGCDVDEADNDGHSPQMLAVFGGADFNLYADEDSTSIEELKVKWVEEEEEKKNARLAAEVAEQVCTRMRSIALSASPAVFAVLPRGSGKPKPCTLNHKPQRGRISA